MPLPRPFTSYHNFELAFTRLIRGGNKEYKQHYRHLFPSYNLALKENLTDLAHAKDQKTGANTRPVSFKEAAALFKRAQQAWAELIREWIKIL
jgi:hypothetical protein